LVINAADDEMIDDNQVLCKTSNPFMSASNAEGLSFDFGQRHCINCQMACNMRNVPSMSAALFWCSQLEVAAMLSLLADSLARLIAIAKL